MTVHHCPRCELRFALRGDLVDHVRRDHAVVEPAVAAPAPTDTRIVVPLDPSHPGSRAVDVAVGLAGDTTLVDLVSVRDAGLPGVVLDAFLAAERDQFPGVRTEVHQLDGPDVVKSLLGHVVGTACDLVVLSSHGRGPLGELLLGSVSADLVRSSPAPTLLVGPSCRPDVRTERLVVGVDGSEDSLGALDVASHLANRFGLRLELVEVAEEVPWSSDVFESAELQRLAATVDPPVRSWDVLHGNDVSRSLIDHVGTDVGAVLVLGTHGRSPGRPHVLGGVAARTVRHAPVPVLVVSPEAASTVAARELAAAPR
jgi:nucleotide-binding universal stress UspA family protein